jgi:hypothetical protein
LLNIEGRGLKERAARQWLCWWFVVVMLVRMKRKESFVIHIELALIVLYCLNCKDEENNEFFS